MSDIVERLRGAGSNQDGNWSIYDDAADEIERLRARLAEAEKSRDQYKAIVDRYCLRHDLKSCACEFGDDSDEPIQRCNYHLDLSNKLAEAERDAARYRWLRDSAGNDIMEKLMAECSPPRWDELVDAAIDAAMGEKP